MNSRERAGNNEVDADTHVHAAGIASTGECIRVAAARSSHIRDTSDYEHDLMVEYDRFVH